MFTESNCIVESISIDNFLVKGKDIPEKYCMPIYAWLFVTIDICIFHVLIYDNVFYHLNYLKSFLNSRVVWL